LGKEKRLRKLNQRSLDMSVANPSVQSASPYMGLLARHPLVFFFIAYAGSWLVALPYVRFADGVVLLPFRRFATLSIAAVVVLSLPACGGGGDSEPTSSSTLPRDVVIPLSEVKEVLPEMSQEIATGVDETALGKPSGSRSVTYATDDGSQRVVISVAQYPSSEDASSTFQEAVQGSREAPGGMVETVSDLGEEALIGTSAQGDETHVGGGARYGDLIVNVTLQAYDGTDENKAKVAELIRKEAATAEQAL